MKNSVELCHVLNKADSFDFLCRIKSQWIKNTCSMLHIYGNFCQNKQMTALNAHTIDKVLQHCHSMLSQIILDNSS